MIDYIHRWNKCSEWDGGTKSNVNAREPGILQLDGDVNSGYWTGSFDSQHSDPVWLGLYWNATSPAGSGLSFRVKVGSTSALGESNWSQEMFEPDDFPNLGQWGRYIEVQANLRRPAGSCITPEIRDIRLRWRPADHYSEAAVVGSVVGSTEEETPPGTEPPENALVISKVGV